MKANSLLRAATVGIVSTSLLLVAGCSEQRVIPPAPSPTPTAAPPPPPPTIDWRQAPLTPGDWTWSMEGGRSVARFGGSTFVMRCDARGQTVSFMRPGNASAAVPVTVRSSDGDRPLSGQPQAGSPPMIVVTVPARDPVLDAMAFSRGRFAVETAGLQTLVIPSWPEVSRVIEDCR
ncbi:MAG: hypothetical protein R3D89_02640 [Sphingomonadaceae bacterium]